MFELVSLSHTQKKISKEKHQSVNGDYVKVEGYDSHFFLILFYIFLMFYPERILLLKIIRKPGLFYDPCWCGGARGSEQEGLLSPGEQPASCWMRY